MKEITTLADILERCCEDDTTELKDTPVHNILDEAKDFVKRYHDG